MGTVENKLTYLDNTKKQIRQAIIDKGVDVGTDAPFRVYADKVGEISGGGDPTDPYVVYAQTRPADWLPMPTPMDNEMYLLFELPVGTSDLIAFTVECASDYKVEIGTIENGTFVGDLSKQQIVAGGSIYTYTVVADDFSHITSNGMAQCMFKISGSTITSWRPSIHPDRKYPSSGWSIVEIRAKLPSLQDFLAGNQVVAYALKSLRYFSLEGTNSLTSGLGLFAYCYSLIAVLELDTSSIVDASQMFNNCSSLLAIPEINTSSVTNATYMFNNCRSFPTMPKINTGSVANALGMFTNCLSLAAIRELDTSKVEVATSMFSGCHNLKTLPTLNMESCTNLMQLVYGCYSLPQINLLNTGNCINFNNTFYQCYSLRKVQGLDIRSSTSFTTMFGNDFSLSKLTFVPVSINTTGALSIVLCNLSKEALVEMFESLPTLTSGTPVNLTITMNPGVAFLTAGDLAIATNKGWNLIY